MEYQREGQDNLIVHHMPMAQESGSTCSSTDLLTREGSPSGSSTSVVREDSCASGSSAVNASHVKTNRHKKKLMIKTLEKKLKVLDRHIKKCSEAELTLEEMDSGASPYMKEDLYKRKFVVTWQELCKLVQVPDNIEVSGLINSTVYSGTHYPEINRRVQRLIKLGEFPDYFDIVELIDRCDTKHSLSICAEEKQILSKTIFKEVGKILKDRRQQEFVSNFGNHLTDMVKLSDDPALQDSALCQQLLESLQEGQERMERICDEFADKQEQGLDTEKSSNESEEGSEEEEEDLDDLEDVALDEGLDSPLELDTDSPSGVSESIASSEGWDDSTVGTEESEDIVELESSEDERDSTEQRLSPTGQPANQQSSKDSTPPSEVGSANGQQESINQQERLSQKYHDDEQAKESPSKELESPPEQAEGSPSDELESPPEQAEGSPSDELESPPEQVKGSPSNELESPPEQVKGSPSNELESPPEQVEGSPSNELESPPEQVKGSPSNKLESPPEQVKGSPSNEQESPPPAKKPRREESPATVRVGTDHEVITIDDSEDDDVICLD